MARVLVAEDDGALAEFLRHALTGRGHEVTVVGDGGAAGRALARGRYELLISDVVMPVVDGIALSLKVEAQHPDVRIILMSGYPQEQRRIHSLEGLIAATLAKPFTPQQLYAAVERALGSGQSGVA